MPGAAASLHGQRGRRDPEPDRLHERVTERETCRQRAGEAVAGTSLVHHDRRWHTRDGMLSLVVLNEAQGRLWLRGGVVFLAREGLSFATLRHMEDRDEDALEDATPVVDERARSRVAG